MNRADKGFTLVELLLAMTFVSVLLLTIALTVIQIGNLYNKGITLRGVDQASRSISGDIRRTVNQSQPFDLTNALIEQRHSQTSQGENDGGRLCLGQYTYVWNYGKALARDAAINVYDSGDEQIRFARVRDNGANYCLEANLEAPIQRANAVELLSSGDQDLAIQSFSIEQVANDAGIGQALYRIVMEIGTNNQDAINQARTLTTIDTSCKPPSDDQSLHNFCAVNQLDFTAQAGNRGGL